MTDSDAEQSWQPLLPAAELPPGSIVEHSGLGQDFLLYRPHTGDPVAWSGYCPHMSNYMPNGLPPEASLDQLLAGDQLRCPYHGWQFDHEGVCTLIPAGQRQAGVSRKLLHSWALRINSQWVEIAWNESA